MWSLDFESRLLSLALERGLVGRGAATVEASFLDPAKVARSSCWGPRLDALIQAGALDEASVQALAWEALEEPSDAISTPSLPPALDRFEQLSLVGEGATAHVYKAFDRFMQRWVALKRLKSSHPGHQKRLMEEARAQAQVDHPHVCKVFDVVETEEGGHIILQLAEGGTLAHARERLSAEQKVQIVREVASGVHAAHQKGLLHLDLKPGNILLQGLHPLVGDFGMVRSQGFGDCPMGTPPYTSPEQLDGDLTKVDARSDIYALGMLLYVLLAGKFPFEAKDFASMVAAMRSAPPAPLPASSNPWGKDLDAILTQALAKNPSHRYATASDFAEDLDRLLKTQPVRARNGGVLYRAGRWVKRNPKLAVASTALVLAIIVGGTAAYQALQAQRMAFWAQHYEAEADDLDAYVQRIYTLPAHDMTAEMDVARDKVKALESEVANAHGVARGPAHYALGKAYGTMDYFNGLTRSQDQLQMAYDLGFRPPEARIALAEAYGRRCWEDYLRLAFVLHYQTPEILAHRMDLVVKHWGARMNEVLQGLDGTGKPWDEDLRLLKTYAGNDLDQVIAVLIENHQRHAWDWRDELRLADAYDLQMDRMAWDIGPSLSSTLDGAHPNDPVFLKFQEARHCKAAAVAEARRLAPGLPILALWDEASPSLAGSTEIEGIDWIQRYKTILANRQMDPRDPTRQANDNWAALANLMFQWSAYGRDPRPSLHDFPIDPRFLPDDSPGMDTYGVELAYEVACFSGEVSPKDLQDELESSKEMLEKDRKDWHRMLGQEGVGVESGAAWVALGPAAEQAMELGESPLPMIQALDANLSDHPATSIDAGFMNQDRGASACLKAEWAQLQGQNPDPAIEDGRRSLTAFRDFASHSGVPAWIRYADRLEIELARLAMVAHPEAPQARAELKTIVTKLSSQSDSTGAPMLHGMEWQVAESAILLSATSDPKPSERKAWKQAFQKAVNARIAGFPRISDASELEAEWILRAHDGPLNRSNLVQALSKAEAGLQYPKLLSEAEVEKGLRHPISPLAFFIAHQGRTYALIGEIQLALADRAKGAERTKWAHAAKTSFDAALQHNRNLQHRVQPMLDKVNGMLAS